MPRKPITKSTRAPKKPLTLRDLARATNLSPATISLVINQRPQVSPQTAARVHQAMQALNFTPPPPEKRRGRKLGSKAGGLHGKRVVFLATGVRSVFRTAPVYIDLVHSVEKALAAEHATMQLRQIHDSEVLPVEILPCKVDAAIIFGRVESPAVHEALRGIPAVHVMSAFRGANDIDHVSYDNSLIGPLAAGYLLGRGHQSCAFVGVSPPDSIWRERAETFCSAIRAGGAQAASFTDDQLFSSANNSNAVDAVRLTALLDGILHQSPRVTGLFVAADLLVNALYPMLYERGIRPGKDLDVVSCNNERLLIEGLRPQPAVVDIHAEEIGRRAVEQLIWRISHWNQPPSRLLITPTLVCPV